MKILKPNISSSLSAKNDKNKQIIVSKPNISDSCEMSHQQTQNDKNFDTENLYSNLVFSNQ